MARAPHETVPCDFCGHPVHPGQVGTYGLVTGWGEYRESGGMNAVRLAEHHHKYAHRTCVDRATRGHRRGQTSLEEEAAPEVREELQETGEALPIYDGTQSGMTAVACPHCDYCGLADRMELHIGTNHT